MIKILPKRPKSVKQVNVVRVNAAIVQKMILKRHGKHVNMKGNIDSSSYFSSE
jgi:hypothetical protein